MFEVKLINGVTIDFGGICNEVSRSSFFENGIEFKGTLERERDGEFEKVLLGVVPIKNIEYIINKDNIVEGIGQKQKKILRK